MRGLVLAMMLSPVMVDESIAPARGSRGSGPARSDLGELRGRLLRRPILPELEPIPLWSGPVPWRYIPPVWSPPEAEPARRPGSPESTLRSLGIIPVRLELPVNDRPAH